MQINFNFSHPEMANPEAWKEIGERHEFDEEIQKMVTTFVEYWQFVEHYKGWVTQLQGIHQSNIIHLQQALIASQQKVIGLQEEVAKVVTVMDGLTNKN